MCDMSGDSSREKTTEWLEDVLQTYFTYKKKIKCGSGDLVDPVDVSVVDFDIGPGFSGDTRISTLSDLLSLQVKFKIGENTEEKTEDLLVKIPPNDKAERQMAQIAQVDKREIHFYTEALTQLREWIKSRSSDVSINVPTCYFAKYQSQSITEDVDGENGPSFNDAESVLVLEDMRPKGYTMKDFNKGLTIEETFAALKEIGTIHAVSWAFQQGSDVPLDEKWDFAYRPRKAASAYKMMIEQGFPSLALFLERQKPDGEELLSKLKALHPKAAELLYELLEPPPPPIPSCLTHMDFWCNNLLFRESSKGETNGANGEMNTTDCMIVDWQMMAISRPTHDVALLLFTSLTPEVRQKNSELFLKHYWKVFQDTVAQLGTTLPFGYEVIENEYRKSQLLALLLVIGSIDLALDVPATEHRLLQALRDLAKEDLI